MTMLKTPNAAALGSISIMVALIGPYFLNVRITGIESNAQ